MKNQKKVKTAAPETKAKKIEPPKIVEKPKKIYQVLRGMHDILPEESKYWKKILHVSEALSDYFKFGRIITPTLEEASLFVRSVGKGTDIVEKEMYLFEDRDGTKVALRPEGTASASRAYISNGFWNQVQPVKMWYVQPMFRHERPQAGRYREHYQVGFESFGIKDPAVDAEVILLGYNIFQDLGLPVTVNINSIGSTEDRTRYKAELTNYYRTKRSYLCEDCKIRLTKNPLRLLDCKEEACQPIKEEAPQIIDWLSEDSKKYFMKVLEFLDELSIPYNLTPTLVRGLDYYTDTIFEFYLTEDAGGALGGGGRYDLLVEELGGKATPAAGAAFGIERIVLALKTQEEKNKEKIFIEKTDVFFAQIGEEAKRRALRIMNDLRHSGLQIGFNFFKSSLKNQLELANAAGAPYVLILGQKEVQDKTIIIRDMESGVQEIIDQKKIEAILKKKLQLAV